MPLTAVTVLAGLMVRFRRRRGRERQQIKWLLAGVALMTVLILAGLGISFGLGNTLGDVMVNAALLGPLVGIGVALLRHQLYNIDVIIRRTLVYSVLTVLLALVYFGSVVLLQSLVATIEVEQSTSVIVFSTLAIAALFSPLRKRVQEVIDRRFYRRKYDAAQTLAAFAAMARDEVDLDALTAELLHVIDKTIQPSHVSLWIRELET
jgi:asparagine N-glycosylation enzyme membrane subunit Stt3